MMPWRRQVRDAREAVLCLRIAGAIPLTWLAVRVLPLPRALALLGPLGRQKAKGKRQRAKVKQTSGYLPLLLPFAVCPLPFAFPQGRPVSPERTLYLTELLLDRGLFGIRATCLLRSLVLYRFLRQGGVSVQLHLGVARDGQALAGHAWLTLDGRPMLEAGDPADRFKIVLSYPES